MINLRVVEQAKKTVLAEIYNIDPIEIPVKGTEIYVNSESEYVRQVIKSYEPSENIYQGRPVEYFTWFVVEV